jgi:phosphoenolpyruvate-protein kinase (PTS system EI component)
MPETVLRGTAASPGSAVGVAWRFDDDVCDARIVSVDSRPAELARAQSALGAAAQALESVASTLGPDDREIVEAGALMAHDPALHDAVHAAIIGDGLAAGPAILRAGETFARAIAALPDPHLAARAEDVRSLARRAARLAVGVRVPGPSGHDVVLIGRDVGPADVAEAAGRLAGVALAEGGATAHAAIVARSLGIPMVSGLGAGVLSIADQRPVVIDGDAGTVTEDPGPARAGAAHRDMETRRRAARRVHELRDEPAITTNGVQVVVLANVASRAELDVGLAGGAEGVGLLRTELAFLDAPSWPSRRDHVDALRAVLDGLGSRPAVVRVLDFGADKAPPFLHGTLQRGLELLLAHPEALADQLLAILEIAERRDVRIMLPMVQTVSQLRAVRGLLEELATGEIPPVGVMIETVEAVDNIRALAAEADFFSLGTNDLTAAILGVNRFAANPGRAHHPLVLRAVARSVAAAREAAISLEVCGEAASDPAILPILVGLGVDELSVGAARVGEVRGWIRRLDAREASGLARSALTMDTADEVKWAAEPLAAELAAG